MKHIAILVTITLLLCISLNLHAEAEDHIIKPGDVLQLTVYGEPELTRQVTVSAQGGISLPLINIVHIADLTITEASEKIGEKLKAYMKFPEVSIELVEPAGIRITVSGEVIRPGIYTLSADSRLLDAITFAGGYKPDADLSKISVSQTGVETSKAADLTEFLLTGDISANIPLNNGDTIHIPAITSKVKGMIMVLGAVRQSGEHPLNEGMTLREAILLAGGPTEFADLHNIALRREGMGETVYDYSRAVSGELTQNPELKPGDALYVSAVEQFGYYTVQGGVSAPGRYEIKGRTTLTEAIAMAGGTRDRAKLNNITILRTQDGQTFTMNANVREILAGRIDNMPIQDGDNIFIPVSKEPTDIWRIASILVSIGWLLTR